MGPPLVRLSTINGPVNISRSRDSRRGETTIHKSTETNDADDADDDDDDDHLLIADDDDEDGNI